MSSGFRRLRINTQERAVSSDINRLQTFASQDIAEIFRGLVDAYVTTDDDDLSEVAPGTIESPVRAEIINGLMVKPQGGVLDLFVDLGAVFILAPDAAPDESNYKLIRDVGIATPGLLQMTANASGSTRIDVIECSINPVEAIVTDSRDIFDASSGLFATATVTKELRGRLQYRVRAGTPGAGMPAHQAGWLPLCVASVPTGTTTNDSITFWDVRPLLSDRPTGVSYRPSAVPVPPYVLGRISYPNAAGGGLFSGYARATLSGRQVGGTLRRGSPGSDAAASINLNDAANYESGVTFASAYRYYVYLMTPFGLPRWARYTDGPAGRTPRSPKGIPVMSKTGPSGFSGKPSAGIVMPAAFGFGSTAQTEGVCIAASQVADQGSGIGTVSTEFSGSRQVVGSFGGVGANLASMTYLATILGAGPNYFVTLTPGVDYPKNARRLLCLLEYSSTVTATTAVNSRVLVRTFNFSPVPFPGTGDAISVDVGGMLSNPTGGSANYTQRPFFDLELPFKYPAAAVPHDVVLQPFASFQTAPSLIIVGWEF